MTNSGHSDAKKVADKAGGATEAHPSTPVEKRPSKRRRAVKWTAHGVGLLVGQAMTLTLIIVFAILVRLQGDPIDLSAFAPTIEAAINRNIDGEIEIGGVIVSTHKASDEPRVQLSDVRLRDADGKLVLSAPRFSARFDQSLLLSGEIAPTSLTLIGPTAILTRTADGAFRFGIGGAEPDEGAPVEIEESPVDAFSTFAAGLAFPDKRREPFTELNSIAIRQAYLIYRDEVSGRVWRAPDSFLRVWAGGEGARAFAKITLRGPGHDPTALTLTGRRLRAADRVQVKASFSDLLAEDLASQIPAFEMLKAAEGALDGGLDLDLAPNGELHRMEGSLRADSVVAHVGGEERLLDYVDTNFSFEAATNLFRVEAFEASALGVTAALSGEAAVTLDADNLPSSADISLGALRVTIARPDLYDEPVEIRDGRLSASLDLSAAPKLALKELSIVAGADSIADAKISATGGFALTDEGPSIDLSVGAGDLRAPQVTALWPKIVGRNARTWVKTNVREALVSNVRADLTMTPGAKPSAVLEFDLAQARSTYFGEMPPIVDGVGSAGIKDGAFHLKFDTAAVETPDGAIDISGSDLEIRNLFGGIPTARITIQGEGPSAAVLNVIDQKPLQLPSKLGIQPSDVGGEVEAVTVLELPLLKDLPLEDVLLDIDATLSDVSMKIPNSNVVINASEAALTADQDGMEVSGRAAVGGQPADVTWREQFVVVEGPRRRMDFKTTYTRDQAVAAGVPGVMFREGKAPVTGNLIFIDGQPPRLSAKADLTNALLETANIGWRKEIGTPGSLALTGKLADVTSINVDLDMPGLGGEGVVSLRNTGAHIDIGRLSIATIGEFSGEVLASESKIDVVLSSPSVDLEPFLGEGAADTSGFDAPDLSIALNADGAKLTGDLWAGALSGQIDITDGEQRAAFNGLINGDAPFTGDYTGTETESRLVIRSNEAGRALKALGALESGRGGDLRLDLRLAGADAPIEGEVHIENIVITEAPVLAEILSVASLVGAVDKLASGGVTFTTIESDFRAEGDRIYVSNAAAFGPTVGLTAQGSYDLKGEAFDLSGSISPAYVINGIFNAVPLFGEALTGGEGEGVFGIAYELKGPASAPKISVNPLSVLAIGPFRRLFSGSADAGTGGGDAIEGDVIDEKTWRERQRERQDAFE